LSQLPARDRHGDDAKSANGRWTKQTKDEFRQLRSSSSRKYRTFRGCLANRPNRPRESCSRGQTNRVFWRIAGKVLFCVSSLTAVCRPTSEDVMDVTTWLRGLGLERHEATFRDNLIDMDVVRELNENDLEKLGLALG
jgi:hypothetical protein